jgi:hypothetical protein
MQLPSLLAFSHALIMSVPALTLQNRPAVPYALTFTLCHGRDPAPRTTCPNEDLFFLNKVEYSAFAKFFAGRGEI